MARNYQPPHQIDYYGGQNDADDPINLLKNEAIEAKNCLLRKYGALQGRPGLTLVGDDTGDLKIRGEGVLNNANGKKIIRVVNGASNSTIQYLSGTTWTALSTVTRLKDVICDVIQAGDNLYVLDGNSADVVKWDGLNSGSATTVAAIPKGSFGDWFKEHFFIAKGKILYFSDLGLPDNYTAANYITFPSDITGVRAYFNSRLIVTTKYDVFILEGNGASDWVVTGKTVYSSMEVSWGVVSHFTLRTVENELWGMDADGNIRRIFRSPNDVLFGEIISGKIDNFRIGLNRNSLSKAYARYIDGYYLFSAPSTGQTENDSVAVYDVYATLPANVSRWVIFTGWHASCFSVFEASNTPELYIHESRDDSKTYKWSGTSDNGTAIVLSYKTKKETNGVPNLIKSYRWGKIKYAAIGNYNASLLAAIDSDTYTSIDSLNMAGEGDAIETEFTVGVSAIAGNDRLEKVYYPKNGGGDISGNSLSLQYYMSYTLAIPEFYQNMIAYKLLKFR